MKDILLLHIKERREYLINLLKNISIGSVKKRNQIKGQILELRVIEKKIKEYTE